MRPVETLHRGPAPLQALGRLVVETRGPGFTEITREAASFVAGSGIVHGLLTVYCRHTSASLLIQENADPDVRTDLLAALDRLAPRGAPGRAPARGVAPETARPHNRPGAPDHRAAP